MAKNPYPAECPAFEIKKLSPGAITSNQFDHTSWKAGDHFEGSLCDTHSVIVRVIEPDREGFYKHQIKPLTRAARQMLDLVDACDTVD